MTGAPSAYLRGGERLDDLGGGRRVIQHPGYFRFGTDAVLLSRFARLLAGERVVDLCSGSCVLPLLLMDEAKGLRFDAVELQEALADMASRSVSLNGFGASIRVLCADLKDAPALLGHGAYDVALCNPPYDKPDASWPIADESRRLARCEVACTLEDVAASMSALLRNGGRAYMIHRAARMADVFEAFRRRRLEPKTMRLAYAAWGKPAAFMLLEAIKHGGAGLNVADPVLIGAG